MINKIIASFLGLAIRDALGEPDAFSMVSRQFQLHGKIYYIG
jgi:hypothetical protein